jgi:tetratricopeptide (TPR) repeat protein
MAKMAAEIAVPFRLLAIVLCAIWFPEHGFNYAAVQDAIQSGHFEQARTALDAHLKVNPGDGYAHLLMGIVLSELKEPAEAEWQFREASRLRPRDPAPHTNLGDLLASRGHLLEAMKQFEAALALNPADATSLSNLGSVQMSLKQYRFARNSFAAAAKIAPNDIPTLIGLFQAQLKLALVKESQETANRLLSQPAIDERTIQIVGALQGESGDYANAVRSFEKGARLFPDSPGMQFNLGLALQKSGDAARASDVLEALRLNQDSAELEDVLGEVSEQKGAFLEAVRSYQRAAEMEPRNEGYRFDYTCELLAHLNFEAARLVSDRAVHDFPDSVRMNVALGLALFGLERVAEAQQLFLRTARRFPDVELPLVYLTLCGEASDTEVPEAENLLMAFYRKHPNGFMAPYLLARAALNRHAAAQAANLLNASVKLRSDYAPAHFELGRALVELGRVNDAVVQYRTALKIGPKNAETFYRLTLAYRKLGEKQLAQEAEAEFRKLGTSDGKAGIVQTFLYSVGK